MKNPPFCEVIALPTNRAPEIAEGAYCIVCLHWEGFAAERIQIGTHDGQEMTQVYLTLGQAIKIASSLIHAAETLLEGRESET